jgi:hypothetical protein
LFVGHLHCDTPLEIIRILINGYEYRFRDIFLFACTLSLSLSAALRAMPGVISYTTPCAQNSCTVTSDPAVFCFCFLSKRLQSQTWYKQRGPRVLELTRCPCGRKNLNTVWNMQREKCFGHGGKCEICGTHKVIDDDSSLLVYSAAYIGIWIPTFRRSLPSPSSGYFSPESGSRKLFQHFETYVEIYTASYFKGLKSVQIIIGYIVHRAHYFVHCVICIVIAI